MFQTGDLRPSATEKDHSFFLLFGDAANYRHYRVGNGLVVVCFGEAFLEKLLPDFPRLDLYFLLLTILLFVFWNLNANDVCIAFTDELLTVSEELFTIDSPADGMFRDKLSPHNFVMHKSG